MRSENAESEEGGMKRRGNREIERMEVEGLGSSFVLGGTELEAEAEGSPRPETVHPPRVKNCNCDMGLFKQLREMVARGEVMERSFMAAAADAQNSAAFCIEFEHGRLQDDGREWQVRVNPELKKLAEVLMFSGKFEVLMVGGRVVSTGYVEDFSHGKASRN